MGVEGSLLGLPRRAREGSDLFQVSVTVVAPGTLPRRGQVREGPCVVETPTKSKLSLYMSKMRHVLSASLTDTKCHIYC